MSDYSADGKPQVVGETLEVPKLGWAATPSPAMGATTGATAWYTRG